MAEDTAERWNKLQGCFEEAMALEEKDRDAFVASLQIDEELRQELAGMIRFASSGGTNIFQSISRVAETASASIAQPRRFGPYRIVREIGRGGMGVVYEAQREDEFQQRVALKIAPQWQDDETLHSRIRHERQVLASLQHPNIARLLDGGSEHGVPYFVMEYVEGIPLTVFAKERSLPLDARIALFQQVLSGVHHAHLSMVVHRDLKPSNVLVTADAVPKLLDFGIAKLLDPMASPSQTASGMLWTPDYASPEQVRGLPVTAASDVYSLGLILYELLTGSRAQTADTSSPLALDRSICETEPPLASERARAQGDVKLARQLEGDLDNIITKAIAKEPARRYASTSEYNADLTRYLDGLPVLARPSTFSYRASKYLRRRKGMVAAALLLGASVAIGLFTTVHQARRAEHRFQQVRALANAFVFDVHDRIQFLPGSTPARQAIVQTALRYLENLKEDASGDVSLSRELAAAYLRIGDVQGNPSISNLGDRDGALQSYRKAQALLAPLVNNGDRESRIPLATVEASLAKLAREQGNAKSAAGHYRKALDIAQAALNERSADPDLLGFATSLYSELTRSLLETRNPEVGAAAGQAMQFASRLAALDPSNPEYIIKLASAHSSLGAASLAVTDIEQAAISYRESTRLRADLVRLHPENVAYRRDLIIGYGTLGEVLGGRTGENLGDTTGAIAAFQAALDHTRWLRTHDPADRRAIFDDISVKLRLGAALLEARNPEAALESLRPALAENLALLSREPANYRYRLTAAFLLRKRGEAAAMLGRHQEAVRDLERAIQEYEALLAGPSASASQAGLLITRIQLATVLAISHPPSARRAADEIAARLTKTPGMLTPVWNQAKSFGDLGRIYQRLQQPVEARVWLDKSIALWRVLKVPKALEAVRQRELASVETSLRATPK